MSKLERQRLRKVQACLIALRDLTEGPPEIIEALDYAVYELCIAIGHQDELVDSGPVVGVKGPIGTRVT